MSDKTHGHCSAAGEQTYVAAAYFVFRWFVCYLAVPGIYMYLVHNIIRFTTWPGKFPAACAVVAVAARRMSMVADSYEYCCNSVTATSRQQLQQHGDFGIYYSATTAVPGTA